MLKVDNIDVYIGIIKVLSNVSIEVNKREKVVLLGANGAGKTTLLRTISGLIPTKGGEIVFEGERISKLPAHEIVERGICQVPEGRWIFPKLTVQDNLKIGAFTAKARKKRDESFGLVFTLFPILKQRCHQIAETLSGGEAQMLSIGRSLMADPKLLMLDEISLGLAPKIVTKLFEVIDEINSKGVSILMVEQNVRNALKIADRGYVLERGQIVLEGSSLDLLNNPHVKNAYLGI